MVGRSKIAWLLSFRILSDVSRKCSKDNMNEALSVQFLLYIQTLCILSLHLKLITKQATAVKLFSCVASQGLRSSSLEDPTHSTHLHIPFLPITCSQILSRCLMWLMDEKHGHQLRVLIWKVLETSMSWAQLEEMGHFRVCLIVLHVLSLCYLLR